MERSSHRLIWSTILAFTPRDQGKQWKTFAKILYTGLCCKLNLFDIESAYLQMITTHRKSSQTFAVHYVILVWFLGGHVIRDTLQGAGCLIRDSSISVLSLQSPLLAFLFSLYCLVADWWENATSRQLPNC